MYEDWEPWVRRLGLAALLALLLVFVVLIGGWIFRTMGEVFGVYRTAEQQTDTAIEGPVTESDGR